MTGGCTSRAYYWLQLFESVCISGAAAEVVASSAGIPLTKYEEEEEEEEGERKRGAETRKEAMAAQPDSGGRLDWIGACRMEIAGFFSLALPAGFAWCSGV